MGLMSLFAYGSRRRAPLRTRQERSTDRHSPDSHPVGRPGEELVALKSELDELRLENELLANRARVDRTTGLPNAAAFELDLLQLDARRRRSEQPYSVLLAALDRPGDDPCTFDDDPRLHAVADLFKTSVRQGDRAYRYDGVRFAVLLTGADLPNSVAAGERFRSRVETALIQDASSPTGFVTVTVGVLEAGFRHRTAKDVLCELESLVAEASTIRPNQLVWPH